MNVAPTDGNNDDPPGGLTAAEVGMWHAFRNGSDYDLRTGDSEVDDPHGNHPWGPERSVRARIVARLLLDGPPALPGRLSSLKLYGVRITDVLDLAGGTVVPYVGLRQCRFDEEVLLTEARFTTVRLLDCLVPRLEAARVYTTGDLYLSRCHFHQGIRLTGARIGTELLLNEAVVRGDRRGNSIMADGISVGQDLRAEMLESLGELSLRGATVGFSLSLRGSRLRCTTPGLRALNAPQMTVGHTLDLTSMPVFPPRRDSAGVSAFSAFPRAQRFERTF